MNVRRLTSAIIIPPMKKKHTTTLASTPLRNNSDVAQQLPAQAPAVKGRVEKLSTEFAIGWATVSRSKHPTPVFATVDGEIIGFAVANISRVDLDRARQEGQMDAYAFIVVFDRPVPAEQVQSIKILIAGQTAMLPQGNPVKIDRSPPLRLFLMGSPRSGTSQLGRTLSKVLELPWLGEGHAAPLFASAAVALSGDANDKNGISRFMAHQGFRQIAIEAAKKAYFFLHGSASFVDKTPGVKMIGAAPFLNECFPGSRFVFQRRNPVSNVLSRMAKFGGNFESHCMDWAGAMNEWLKVRPLLPHYVEIQQEDMLEAPNRVAKVLAEYIGIAECADHISESLKDGSLERTGAGVGQTDRLRAGWTAEQVAAFERICGPAMRAFGYNQL
jgi:hypothetical protein